MIFNIVAIESFTWYLATKYIRVIRKNEKIDVDGSGGLDVPDEFDGNVLSNGFFLGWGGTVYGGIVEFDVLFWLLLLLVAVDVDELEPELFEELLIISNMYNLF